MWQLIEILRMASILQPLLIFALASSGGFAEDASGLVTSLNIMLKNDKKPIPARATKTRNPKLFFVSSSTATISTTTICWSSGTTALATCGKTELQNVKSFTRNKIVKPDFTPRKARKSQHFFKPTKQNLKGFLWWINVDKLSIHGSLSTGS